MEATQTNSRLYNAEKLSLALFQGWDYVQIYGLPSRMHCKTDKQKGRKKMKIKDLLDETKLDQCRKGVFGVLDEEYLDEVLCNRADELTITEYALLRIARELTYTRQTLDRIDEKM